MQHSVPKASAERPIDLPAALLEHERWLRTVVLARVGERQAVDEVMQEVSLATVAGRSAPSDPRKVPAWLYRVAVTQALLYRRKMGRRRKLVDRYVQKSPESAREEVQADPLAWLLAAERRQLIRTALELLPPKDSEILLLKYTEDWSYRELASRLDLSESAVEARLHRARKKLREKLTQLQVSPAE